MPHPIENIMKTTMEQLKEMVDVNTIVGEPMISSTGTMIVPISKVSTGFVSGGGEYCKGEAIKRRKEDLEIVEDIRHPFAGSSAAGVSLTPISFLVVDGGAVKVLPAQYDCTIDRLVEMLPRALDETRKFICGLCGKKEEGQNPTQPLN